MPELPEVDALCAFLREQMVGESVAEVELASISVLKTFDPPLVAFGGLAVTGVARHGKFIDIDVDGLHLVIHLARAGWIRWSESLAGTRLKLNGPIAARLRLADGTGFDLTEAGTKKSVALYAVRDPAEVPGIAALGPDALDPALDLDALLGRRMQIKRLLRDQKVLAGIGNAYSDEILHAARLSPFAIAENLGEAERKRLAEAMRAVLTAARDRAAGKPPSELKDNKRSNFAVHARAGQPCPVCGDTVAQVSFADSSLEYCPTCQTGGQLLKNRTTSKFLK